MVVVGGAALWGLRGNNWLVLLVVVVSDMFILVMLFSAAIVRLPPFVCLHVPDHFNDDGGSDWVFAGNGLQGPDSCWNR